MSEASSVTSATGSNAPEKAADDSSKLKTFLSILRKYVFVGNNLARELAGHFAEEEDG